MRRLLGPRRRNWPTRYVLDKHLGNHADSPDKSEIAQNQLEPTFRFQVVDSATSRMRRSGQQISSANGT